MDRGIIETTINTCRAIIDFAYFKCSVTIGLITYSFFFGDIEKAIIISVMVLTIFDMITGIMASVKTGHDIKSKRLLNTAIKLFIYMLLISAGHLTESAIGLEIKADEIITSVIALTEIISILENASRMGYATPKKYLNQLKDFKSQK